ncbi:MAG: ATP-binding cassette domain-containing protein [Eubacteriales bacterium]
MGKPVLEVKDLNVSFYENQKGFFSKKKKRQVLNHIEFTIESGEIVGLVGESGCGKSTLAKTILGLNKKFEGTIETSCKTPQMVFQDPYSSLNPAKRIAWILMEPLKMHRELSREEMQHKVDEMLEKVGLPKEVGEKYPSQLSGGQRQRVGIAVALMLEPTFLVADEPVSALDVTMQKQILKLLKTLHEEMELAVLFISHDLRVVYQLCDRVMIMQHGKIVEEGRVEEVFANPQHAYTRMLLDAVE